MCDNVCSQRLPLREDDIQSSYGLDTVPPHKLELSVNPMLTLRKLMRHELRFSDGEYGVLFAIVLFCAIVDTEPGWLMKCLMFSGIILALLIPLTSQFFLPFLPILTWLLLFYSCRFIPLSWRPSIWVSVLPSLETILYGGNLSNVLASTTNPVLDVLAWLPYGIMHYGAPFVTSALIFIFGSPGSLPVFARSFGYMNIAGVIIQLTFPSSPPWYEALHGYTQATYDMPGSPGGLARIDELFGFDLYTSTFEKSPLVFGAFPSLHSGSAVLEALFLSYIFPKLTPLFMFYASWIWWSTMYLTHHYFTDLMGGALLAITIYVIAEKTSLPLRQEGKRSRWQYNFIDGVDPVACIPSYSRASSISAQYSTGPTEYDPLLGYNTKTESGSIMVQCSSRGSDYDSLHSYASPNSLTGSIAIRYSSLPKDSALYNPIARNFSA
ncbi:PAP2 superfamily-domain-containing protein [Dipodascopsis uninucleata]